MLVPNSVILGRTVINWTLIDKTIRTVLRIGVAYGSPVREVERLIYEAVNGHDSIKHEPAPMVVFEDFGDNALAFEVYFWCDVAGERQLRQIRSDLRFKITDLFTEHGITIAFPQRDVHLDASKPLQIELMRPQPSGGGA